MRDEPTSDDRPVARRLPWWRKAMPLAGFVLLTWVLMRLDLAAIGRAYAGLSTGGAVWCALLFSLNLVLKVVRWQRMLVAQGFALPLPTAAAAFLNGQFYGQITLGRVGEMYRAEVLVERGVAFGEALSSSIYDRLLDVGLVTLLAAALGGLVLGRPDVAPWALAIVAFGALGVWWLAGKAPATASSAPDAVPSGARPWARILGFAHGLRAGMRPLLRAPVVAEMTAWTLVAWLGYFGALVALARGLDIDASATLLVASASLAALSALLPVTVSGLGAREVIFIQALSIEGVAPERAVALSLLHLAIMTASVLTLGLGGMLWRREQRARDADTSAPPRGG